MLAKKFSPNLLGIPEEDTSVKVTNNNISDNGKINEDAFCKKAFANTNTASGKKEYCLEKITNCCSLNTKEQIIQKWLEGVPSIISNENVPRSKLNDSTETIENSHNMLLKAKMRQELEPEHELASNSIQLSSTKKPSTKSKPPPLPPNFLKTINKMPRMGEVREEPNKESSLIKIPELESGASNVSPICSTQISPTDVKLKDQKKLIDGVSTNTPKNIMDTVIQELEDFKNNNNISSFEDLDLKQNTMIKVGSSSEMNIGENFTGKNQEEIQEEEKRCKPEPNKKIVILDNQEPVPTDINYSKNSNNEKKCNLHKVGEQIFQDDHEYEVILLNPNFKQEFNEHRNRDLNMENLSGIIINKKEKNEGYSYVSEVYVNDGYSYSSGDSSPSSYSYESETISFENFGRLTIHVNDSPKQHRKDISNESDAFEPDTLDRKQRKPKQFVKKRDEKETSEKYMTQNFQLTEKAVSKLEKLEIAENFADSLERPTIMLKTNGSFEKLSSEKNVNQLFRNINWSKMGNFGSLREIYEAKNRNQRRRTETTSLVDAFHDESDRISTLSWSEDRRNKLLHRGIVLHIGEEENKGNKSEKWRHRSNFSTNIGPVKKGSNAPPKPLTTTSSSVPSSPSPTSSLSRAPSSRASISPSPTSRSLSSNDGKGDTTCATVMSNRSKRNTSESEPFDSREVIQNNLSTLKSLNVPPPRPPKTLKEVSPPLPPRNAKPPLPPKKSKNKKPRIVSSKFVGRPLPPLPKSRKGDLSPTPSHTDPDAMSTISAASIDSLDSSEYESVYTLPYKEDNSVDEIDDNLLHAKENEDSSTVSKILFQNTNFCRTGTVNSSKSLKLKRIESSHEIRIKQWDAKQETFQKKDSKTKKKKTNKPDDSGYLSTDSNESLLLRNCGKAESDTGQNSETEESFCDGAASESGAESTATDSFFYGKTLENTKGKNNDSKSHLCQLSLRLSDVEVNSDTERKCQAVLVRP